MHATLWVVEDGRTVKLGRGTQVIEPPVVIPPVTTGRDSLVAGTYNPDATTTGLYAGTTLTPSPLTNPSTTQWNLTSEYNGQTFYRQLFYGDMNITATGNIDFVECGFVGGTHTPNGVSAVVNGKSTRAGTGVVTMTDCYVKPRTPAKNRDCVAGHRIHLIRCDLSNGIDGVGMFVLNGQNGGVVSGLVDRCYIQVLSYFFPDAFGSYGGHADGTHNDGIQIQGGADILVEGNAIHCTGFKGAGSSDHPDFPWIHDEGIAFGSGIIIQKQGSTAALANVKVRKNFFGKAMTQANLKPGSYELSDNRFSRPLIKSNGRTKSWGGYAIRGDNKAATNVIGLNTNRWADTNALMTEPQVSGIHWNG